MNTNNLFLTSDQHYGHRNIIKYCNRPFSDQEEMHRELISRHNSVVSKNDTVLHIGDFSLDERLVRDILPQLNGDHYLVPGNHDKCHPCHKKHEKYVRRYIELGFKEVNFQMYIEPFLVNHLPYTGDSHHEARYPEFRPKDDGEWLLHGHIHELWRVNGRMINVGVDAWDYTPVSFQTLLSIKEGTFK